MDWQAISVILGGIGLIGGVLGFFFKNLIEKRFEALETIIQKQQDVIQALQINFQKVQSEMPSVFVKREECKRCQENWTYMQSVIDSKLDILHKKLRKLATMVWMGDPKIKKVPRLTHIGGLIHDRKEPE